MADYQAESDVTKESAARMSLGQRISWRQAARFLFGLSDVQWQQTAETHLRPVGYSGGD